MTVPAMTPLRRFWSRLQGFFQGSRADARLNEEFEAHVQMMTDEYISRGMSAVEARRRARLEFGPVQSLKEAYRDQRGLPMLDAIRGDLVFAWRQIKRNPVVAWAAILSLGLATGATTAAFRLADAVLLRPLPVYEPESLRIVASTEERDGVPDYRDDSDYPTFRRYRDALGDRADSMVVGGNARLEIVISREGGAAEPERVTRQFVSGNVFSVFGLQPAAGRLIQPADDTKPGGHPVAVISHEFWKRRFARDPNAVGRTFELGRTSYQIIGVTPEGYTGTEPGEMTDVFLPAVMNVEALNAAGWSWFRMWVKPKPGHSPEELRQVLQALADHGKLARIKDLPADTPKTAIDKIQQERILILSAGAGASALQKDYRRPLLILGVLAAILLLIACANVANLLTAQAFTRARELALRVAIGAGRRRLIQLMLIESAILAVAATALGLLFSDWTAPLITAMLRVPDDPVRLVFTVGWREFAFTAGLAAVVTVALGLMPAIRAAHAQPVDALKGNGSQPSARFFVMNSLLGSQLAFCTALLFVSGLFVSTFSQLLNRNLGFDTQRIVVVDARNPGVKLSPEKWKTLVDELGGRLGTESAALSSWPLLSGNRWTGAVRAPGKTMPGRGPLMLGVSPEFFSTTGIGLIGGREFRPNDVGPRMDEKTGLGLPGAGVVNERFARVYFDGANPVGRTVEMRISKDQTAALEIVGVVRDAVYNDVREVIRPTIYLPVVERDHMTLMLRTRAGQTPESLTPAVRQALKEIVPSMRMMGVQPQANFVQWRTLRERLLAALSAFFAMVALVLAAIGLFGVLSYAVASQRRELGIRIALGAGVRQVLGEIGSRILWSSAAGAAVGLGAGIAAGRFLETLLFGVKPTDASMSVAPLILLAVVGVVATIVPTMRAMRVDPASTLRSE